MVLATEHLSEPSGSENSDNSYEIVEGGEGMPAPPSTLEVNEVREEEAPHQKRPDTPTQNFLAQIQALQQTISKHRAENITLDIKVGQLENEREDLKIELSRVRGKLAREKAISANRKEKYEEMLEEVQQSPDKISKKLVAYKRRADALESQLKSELADQKRCWQLVNNQLNTENEEALKEISTLKETLEEERAARAQEKFDFKACISGLEERLEGALQKQDERQIELERIKVQNAKLRQEKTQLSTTYEDKISQMDRSSRDLGVVKSKFAIPETMDDLEKMMKETLGDDFENYDE